MLGGIPQPIEPTPDPWAEAYGIASGVSQGVTWAYAPEYVNTLGLTSSVLPNLAPPLWPGDARPQEWGYGYVSDAFGAIGSDIPDVTTDRWAVGVVPPIVWPAPEGAPMLLEDRAIMDLGLEPMVELPPAWQSYIGTS
jgi:hypothetical protein